MMTLRWAKISALWSPRLTMLPNLKAICSGRFYTGMALLQQEGNSETQEKEAALYLQQGLEYVMARALTPSEYDR